MLYIYFLMKERRQTENEVSENVLRSALKVRFWPASAPHCWWFWGRSC